MEVKEQIRMMQQCIDNDMVAKSPGILYKKFIKIARWHYLPPSRVLFDHPVLERY